MTLLQACRKCGAPTEGKHCRQHKPKDRRPSASRRGYTAKWQRFSKSYLRTHTLCVECGAPSAHTDHIDGQGPTGPRGFDTTNLRPLCGSCHSRRTALDQPGGFNAA